MSGQNYSGYFVTTIGAFWLHGRSFVNAADRLPEDEFGLVKQVLYGHGVELLLKAFLVADELQPFEKVRGTEKYRPYFDAAVRSVKHKYGHHVDRLWIAAANRGLPISSEVPKWCRQFDDGYVEHKYPEGATAYVTILDDEKAELRRVVDVVQEALRILQP
jgi:hypothetical protein